MPINFKHFCCEGNRADESNRFKTVTFKNDATLIKDVIQIFVEEAAPLLNISGFAPAFAVQPLSLNIIEKMAMNGGNALGLSTDEGPLTSSFIPFPTFLLPKFKPTNLTSITVMNLNWGWNLTSDDDAVYAAIDRFVSRSVELARKRGLDNRFIYMNYASREQDVFGGYGENSESRLRGVRKMYDEENVFGELWRGYFRLN
jgi:hypothetical protein